MSQLSTKKQIITTTMELLQEKGNVTIKDIAERAYVNVAAINYHFGTKDNLIQQVIEIVVSDLRQTLVETIISNKYDVYDVKGLMLELINIIFQFAEKNTGIINYSFLQIATEPSATNVLVEFFLTDEEFISITVGQLKKIFPNSTQEQLFSKYLIVFSSFIVPFFLSFNLLKQSDEASTKEPFNFFLKYRDDYMNEIKKFLTP